MKDPNLRIQICLSDGCTKRFYWRSQIEEAFRIHLPLVGSPWDGRTVMGVNIWEVSGRMMRDQHERDEEYEEM